MIQRESDVAPSGPAQVRNFCIIAHIDHGKTTLSDRLLEFTKTVEQRQMEEQLLEDQPPKKHVVIRFWRTIVPLTSWMTKSTIKNAKSKPAAGGTMRRTGTSTGSTSIAR